MSRRRRRVFARRYPSAAAPLEARGLGAQRARLLAPVSGRVLELGCGFGANFPHYPETVTELVAVEPEPRFRDLSREKADDLGLKAAIVDGTAEALPVESDSFDTVIATAVLCSVDSQQDALAEIFRVLKPGGALVCFEHVGAHGDDPSLVERAFDAALWSPLNGGCHLSRDTLGAIEAAGFTTEGLRREHFGFLPWPVSRKPHLVGTALKPL
ncbi:methyltransferase domain-containing protein [Glycomyces sp. NPDC046736]|uniref:class I SAM-dependent methyltransferase n=1 Tax=Glycomyces sp. NPDC046736 TaxID=3155615 RepID=UPI00340C36EB